MMIHAPEVEFSQPEEKSHEGEPHTDRRAIPPGRGGRFLHLVRVVCCYENQIILLPHRPLAGLGFH